MVVGTFVFAGLTTAFELVHLKNDMVYQK